MRQIGNKLQESLKTTSARVWIGLALAVTILLVVLFAINNRRDDHGVLVDDRYTFDPDAFMIGYMQSNALEMKPVSQFDESVEYELTDIPVATYIEIARTLHQLQTGESVQKWKMTDLQVDGVYVNGDLRLYDVVVVFAKNGMLDDRSGHYVTTARFDMLHGNLQWTSEWYAKRSFVNDVYASGEYTADAIIGIAEGNGGESFCARSSSTCGLHLEKSRSQWVATFSVGGSQKRFTIHDRTGKVR